MRNWTDLKRAVAPAVTDLSSMSDKDLRVLLEILERAYVHALIEQQLRDGNPGVSNVATPLRSV